MVSAYDWDGKVLLWADIGNEMERNIQGRMGGQHQMGESLSVVSVVF